MPNYDDAADVAEVLLSISKLTTLRKFRRPCAPRRGCRAHERHINYESEPRVISHSQSSIKSRSDFFMECASAIRILIRRRCSGRARHVTPPITIESQTEEVLRRIEKILNHEKLDHATFAARSCSCRARNIVPATRSAQEIYQGVFAEDESAQLRHFIRSLGEDILLRSMRSPTVASRPCHQPRRTQAPGSSRIGPFAIVLLAGKRRWF